MIGWKQVLGVAALLLLLLVAMGYAGFFMHGDREVECLPYADCEFDDEVSR